MMTLVELQDTYAITTADAAAAYIHRIYHGGNILHGVGATPTGTVMKKLWRVHSFQVSIVNPSSGKLNDGQAVRLLAQTSMKGTAVDVTEDVQGSGFAVRAKTPFVVEYGLGVQVHAPMTAADLVQVTALIEVLQ